MEINKIEDDDYGFFKESIDEYYVHRRSEGGELSSCIMENEYGSNEWFEIESLVKMIANLNFDEIERITGNPCPLLVTPHPAVTLLNRMLPVDGRNEHYKYSPLLDAFYKATESSREYQENPTAAMTCLVIIREIWKQVNERSFRRKISSQKSNSKRNEDKTLEYVDWIFLKTQRVLAIRIDLHLEMPNKDPIDQLKLIRKYFRRFLNNRRSVKHFKHEIGYIWKLEAGKVRAGHIHLFIFLDGSRVQKHEFIALKIGEYWKRITEGNGTFFSSHSKSYLDGLKAKGIGIGLGRVESHDLEKRSYLNRMVRYFFKIDQYVSVKILKKMRVFGKGEFPTLTERRLGRPRTKQLTEDLN